MTQPNPNDFILSLNASFERGDNAVEIKATERGNLQRVQSLYQAIVRGDLDAFRGLLGEAVEFEIIGPEQVPFAGSARGPGEATEFVRSNFAKIESQHPEVLDVVAQGDTVIVNGRERGRLVGADEDYAIEWVQRFRFDADLIVQFRQLYSTIQLPDAE